MKVRTLKIDITPSVGTELCGFADRDQPSLYKHDDLFCKLLFLGEGENLIVLIQFDLIGFSTSYSQGFRERLSSFLNLPVSHIQIFASHTHAGPCSLRLNACGMYDPDYLVCMEGLVFNRLGLERDSPQLGKDCLVKWFETRVELGMNRRSKMQTDGADQLGVLSFQDANEDFSALLVNYPMHPVCISDQGISADYPGQLTEILGQELQGNPLVLFGLGPCGDIDPPPISVEDVSWSLARKVMILLNSTGSVKSEKIDFRHNSISWPLEVLGEQQLNANVEAFLDMEEDYNKFGDNYASAVELWRERRMVEIESVASSTIELTIDQIKIGSLNLVFLNAEVFSSFTDIVQSAREQNEMNSAPFRDEQYCLITCANGVVGYLPDHEQWQLGGYEVEVSHVFYDSFRIVPGALEEMAEKLLANYSSGRYLCPCLAE